MFCFCVTYLVKGEWTTIATCSKEIITTYIHFIRLVGKKPIKFWKKPVKYTTGSISCCRFSIKFHKEPY